jgi:hypothetical protein
MFLLPTNRVRPEFCAQCHCPDHEPAQAPLRTLPCVHLGSATREKIADSTADRGARRDVFECELHGRCVPSGLDVVVRSCGHCVDYLPRDPFGPTAGVMKRKADAFLAALPAYPRARYRGRGVVIAGGGERYFASLYITIRALRHVGCRLPIQVWYLGRKDEMPDARKRLLKPFGVECVDADRIRRRHPARKLCGWELKVFATLHSPFEEVLFLDADCYPCRDPELLFDFDDYHEKGAIFWPDVIQVDDRLKWPAFGLANPRRPGSVESGQFVLNKRTSWRALNLTWFYNDHSDYYYRYGYGDKHTFEAAWTRLEQPFVMFASSAPILRIGYVHIGPDGAPLFVHRCCDKFRVEEHRYITAQQGALPVYCDSAPLEKECWSWLAELAQALGVPFAPPRPAVGASTLSAAVAGPIAKSKLIKALLTELVVYDSPRLRKIRLGSAHDGGYVVPDLRLDEVDGLYTVGGGTNLDFEHDFRAGSSGAIRIFDPTTPAPRNLPARADFFPIGLGVDGRSVAALFEDAQPAARRRRLWLKIDIEGCEWQALADTHPKWLAVFEVLVLELHGLTDRSSPSLRRKIACLKKINRHFRLIHAHGNNFAPCIQVENSSLPDCLEVTYFRKDRMRQHVRPNRASLPGPLDAPCDPNAPDLDLHCWPFSEVGLR